MEREIDLDRARSVARRSLRTSAKKGDTILLRYAGVARAVQLLADTTWTTTTTTTTTYTP